MTKRRATKAAGRSLADFASTAQRPPSKRCTTCRNLELAKHIRDFVALRESPEHKPWQTWPWFCDVFLREEHGIDAGSVTTIYNHVRNCLMRR